MGLACAFVIAMTAILGGIWLSSKGMSGAGLTSIIGALAALVSVFVYGKSQQKKELEENQEALVPTPPRNPPAT
jgi:predicted MFS family arabinose efflux permease